MTPVEGVCQPPDASSGAAPSTPHIAVAGAPHLDREQPPNRLSVGLRIVLCLNDLSAMEGMRQRRGMVGAKLALTAVAGRSHRICHPLVLTFTFPHVR
jgi:hypothetical protein